MLPITRHHTVHIPHAVAIAAIVVVLFAALALDHMGNDVARMGNATIQPVSSTVVSKTSSADTAPEAETCAGTSCVSQTTIKQTTHTAEPWFPLVLPALSRF